MSNELLYNQLYERTKDFGRSQFVREIMRLERENNQLKEQHCERTDCGGRLGNSKKVERLENTIKELRSWLEEWLKIIEKQYDELKEPVRKSYLKVTIDTLKEVLLKLNELEGKNE